jgi:uncharacterized protein (TIGR00730 family)
VDNNKKQRKSASYLPAELDTQFLLGDSMRGVRLQLEFAKAEECLQRWGIRSTVVVFGSSRVLTASSANWANAQAVPNPQWERWYEGARRFARIVSERGGAMKSSGGPRDNVIATGGGPGLMEAANRGAFEAGAPSIGFNIQLPDVQEPNPYTTPELTFQFRSFAIRKMHLALRASALVVFPGGFGTLDELFEILTLVQTRKMPAIPIVCYDSMYWERVIDFDFLKEQAMISPMDLVGLRFVDEIEQIVSHVVV